jgi:adenylate cyclase
MAVDSSKLSALINWLVAGAPPKLTFADLVAEIGERVAGAGFSADVAGFYQVLIHPETPGRFNYWSRTTRHRELTISPEQLATSDVWIGSPAADCSKSQRTVILTIGASPEYDHRRSTKADLARGYRQFIYMPLHSQYSIATNVAAFGTKAEKGFSDEERHALRMLQAPLARVIEAFVLHNATVQILSTYVGRGAGNRVLQGNIHRGDAEKIPSIILFTDLRNFTSTSNNKPASQVIEMLNGFFDIVERAIGRNGGEILKFMGDGVLAIFPTPDDLSAQLAAASGAISALEETRAALKARSGDEIQFRASLHLGDIYYGNIGSKSRLDFTAVGPSVNLASRLLSVADELGAETVCSADFHALAEGRTRYLADRRFKGFDGEHAVFAVI